MKISVITVCYNAATTISDTLRSVALQDYPDVEHIIVDGASRDNTLEKIKPFLRSNLRLVSEPDSGLYDAMNKGVKMASGGLIGFLNADDFFVRRDALTSLANKITMNDDAVCGPIVIVDPHQTDKVLRHYSSTSFRKWMLRFGHMPPHPGFYGRRRAFDAVGSFQTDLKIGGDFDWMIRFFHVKGLRMACTERTLLAQRTDGVSTRGLSSQIIINREAEQSCARWHLSTHQAILWSRYLVKWTQYIRRPDDFPPPAAVRIESMLHSVAH